MKSSHVPPSRALPAALALALLLGGAEAPAQVPDSFVPELPPVGSTEKDEEPTKDYKPKGPGATFSAHRKSSTYVLADVMPKLADVLAKSSPEYGDEQTWRSLAARAGAAWDESRRYKAAGERPSDQDEWEKQNRDFLRMLLDDGALLVSWRYLRTRRAKELQKEADDAPARLEEIRKTVEEVDPLWTTAKKYALDGGPGIPRAELEKAKAAYAALRDKRTLVEAAYGAANAAYAYAKTENASKPSLDPYFKEKAALKRWRNAVADFPKVDSQYPGFLAHWAALAETGFIAEVKAWENMQKAFEPITTHKLLGDAPHRFCAVTRTASECVQPTLDLLAKALAGAGNALAADEKKLKEDTDLSAKERTRWFELLRATDPRKEVHLKYAVDTARTESERRDAEKALKERTDAAKAADDEMKKLETTHKERRKALGLPPDDWAVNRG
jgi:hypothetical protein